MSRYTFNPQIARFVGPRIRKIRMALGVSAQAFGDMIYGGGLSETTIIRVELAKTGASLESLCLIALALDTEPAELLPKLADLRAMFPSRRSR